MDAYLEIWQTIFIYEIFKVKSFAHILICIPCQDRFLLLGYGSRINKNSLFRIPVNRIFVAEERTVTFKNELFSGNISITNCFFQIELNNLGCFVKTKHFVSNKDKFLIPCIHFFLCITIIYSYSIEPFCQSLTILHLLRVVPFLY